MAISKNKKILIVQNLTEKLKKAQALVLTDYSGLNVSQINQLRKNIKATEAEFSVVKNTLLQKAGLSDNLQQPTAVLWIFKKDTAPLKALHQFILQNELPKIKFGFWEKERLTPEKILELAQLPGLDQLRAILLTKLQSPLWGLTNALNWNLRKLALILKAPSTASFAEVASATKAEKVSEGQGGDKNGRKQN